MAKYFRKKFNLNEIASDNDDDKDDNDDDANSKNVEIVKMLKLWMKPGEGRRGEGGGGLQPLQILLNSIFFRLKKNALKGKIVLNYRTS